MLQIIKNTPDYAVGVSSAGAMLLAWKHSTPAEGVRTARTSTELYKYMQPVGTKSILYTITFPNVELPDQGALIEISEYLRENSEFFDACVVLLLDEGWRAKLGAALTWAMVKAADYPFPMQPFVSLTKSITWLQDIKELDQNVFINDIKLFIAETEKIY